MERARRRVRVATAALFAVGLALPATLGALDRDRAASTRAEGRNAAPVPALPRRAADWVGFPRRFEVAFADRLGARRELLRARNALHLFGLSVSPTSMFVVGKEGRFFLDTEELLDAGRGARPLRVPELRAWRRALASRARFVAAHGGRLVLVIAPENGTVYADLAPEAYRAIGPSRTDQFVADLARDPPCAVIDLRSALVEARADDAPGDPAAYPHGTHWTPRGALAATRAIVAALARELPHHSRLGSVTLDGVRVVESDGGGDTWAGRLHLDGWLVQADRALDDPGQSWTTTHEPEFERDELATRAHDPAGLPAGIVVHDSFGAYLRPVLPRAFARGVFLWQVEFPLERVAVERPDVVLLVLGERVLLRPPWAILGGELDVDLVTEIVASHVVLERFHAEDLARVCEPRGPLDLRVVNGAIEIVERGAGGLLLLPEIATRGEEALVLELEIELERDSSIAAYFGTHGDPRYLRGRCVRVATAAGRTRVVMEITDPDRAGRIALRLEDPGRPWRLHGLTASGRPR